MVEDKDALLQHYRQMREDLLSAIQGLNDAQLLEPSLDGWSIKDHLAHIALWDDVRATEVARDLAGHESAWRTSGDQDAVFNELSYALRQLLSLDQVRWELETSRRRLNEALASATPRGLDPSLYGEAGLRTSHEAQHVEWIRRWRGEKGI